MQDLNSQQRLAHFLVECPSAAIGTQARTIARLSLIDTLAVSLAGRTQAATHHACHYVHPMRQNHGAIAWLTGERYVPEAAALYNATAAHALDYDDVTPAWRGHPSAVIWPALCAVGQIGHATFGELLDAYALGFEVGAQIGSGLAAHHYLAGWHATSTIGILAATAACARALKLDVQATSNALGLAIAQSAGVQANFGSQAKPFQAGFAAAGAVRATLLAKAKVGASGNALEGPASFSRLYGAAQTIPLALPTDTDIATQTMAIVRCGIEVKQFPNCYATHRAIEAALALHDQIGPSSESDIRAILIEGTQNAHVPLLDRLPGSVDEARFSIEFGVACALTDKGPRLGSFTKEALERSDLHKLMSLTQVRESLRDGNERAARVSVTLADGRQVTQLVTALPGRYGQPAFKQRLAEKVSDCLHHVGLHRYAQDLFDDIVTADDQGDHHQMDSKTYQEIFAAFPMTATR